MDGDRVRSWWRHQVLKQAIYLHVLIINIYMTNKTPTSSSSTKLSKRQREILVGLLLGDGHLETQNQGRTYRLKVEHSLKQKDYTFWLYQEFRDFIPGKVYTRKRGNYEVVGFRTISHPTFRFYGQQFYPEGKKVIPNTIHKMLKPLSLAIWFCDDGSRKSIKHSTFNIHSLGYTKRDLQRVQEVMKSTLKIETTLHKQGKQHRIYIPQRSATLFASIVNPIVRLFPSMNQKLVDNNMPKE